MFISVFCITVVVLTTVQTQQTINIIQQIKLTPSNPISAGVAMMANVAEVSPNQGLWKANIQSQESWQFIIFTDQSWGFHPILPSAISFTVQTQSIATTDLLLSFTANNQEYISMKLPMDNTGRLSSIYPGCSTHTIGVGDISTLPGFDRICDIAGGSCRSWQSTPFQPIINVNTANTSITITLENNPDTNKLYIYLSDVDYFLPNFITLKCEFVAFPADNGIKFYVAGNANGDVFTIDAFDMKKTVLTKNPIEVNVQPPIAEPGQPAPTQPVQTQYVQTTTHVPVLINTETTTTTLHPEMTSYLQTHQPSQHVPPQIVVPPQPAQTQPVETTTQIPALIRTTTTTTTTTLSPLMTLGAFGNICRKPSQYSQCKNPLTDIVQSNIMNGETICNRMYDCCLCKSIECGNVDAGCTEFRAGGYGAFGVSNIVIQGNENRGAIIDCEGIQSCAQTIITAENIASVHATNSLALSSAQIIINNPMSEFTLDCTGFQSCADMSIEITIPGPPAGYMCNPAKATYVFQFDKIQCVAPEACKNMQFTLRNNGCNPVQITGLDCVESDSCIDTNFNFIGDISVSNCFLTGAAHGVTGIDKCFENLDTFLCPDCNGAVRTLTNPVNGFVLTCGGNSGSCADAQLTVNIDQPPLAIHTFDKFTFSDVGSASGATITIKNNQEINLRLETIECLSERSCENTTFLIGDMVSIGQIICVEHACGGCNIKRTLNGDPIPCNTFITM